jgi:hypothetical protein
VLPLSAAAATAPLRQFFWAERLHYLNYGVALPSSVWRGRSADAPMPASALQAVEVAVRAACAPPLRLRCACLGVKIRAEQGCGAAVRIIVATAAAARAAAMEAAPASPTAPRNGGSGLGAACEGQTPTCHVLERLLPPPLPPGLALSEMPNGMLVAHPQGAEADVFHVFNEVFEQRVYCAPPELSTCFPAEAGGGGGGGGGVVVDCGAHCGLFTLFTLLHGGASDDDCGGYSQGDGDGGGSGGAGVRVVAIEPSPLACAALRYNVKRYARGNKVVVVQCALGDSDADDGTLW